MPLLTLQDVCLSLSGKTLLENASLGINVGDRVCLVGRNGVGKSSLLRMLAGRIEPDRGSLVYEGGCRFGFMPQDVPLDWTGPVFCVAAAGMGADGRMLALAHAVSQGRGDDLSKEDAA
ncbi:MAG: ABC-F family ATP-binding cassette domain-containing protein, partial [Desulfovibrio sp.]|nr:ABC-F family ATP-binding cassette domain-containing protein [Desulfovibrio sp.]